MAKFTLNKKIIDDLEALVESNLKSDEIDVETFFRTLTAHVIRLNYDYAVNFFSATAMIAQCNEFVMGDLYQEADFKKITKSEKKAKAGMIESKEIH